MNLKKKSSKYIYFLLNTFTNLLYGLYFNSLCTISSVSLMVIFTLIQQGNAIQASAKGRNIQPFAASIIEGDYYQICGFYTFENKYTNSVVAHEAVIDLKSDTKVTRIDPMTPPISRHYFTFIDFTHLLTTGRRSGVLTGFITSLRSSYVFIVLLYFFSPLAFFLCIRCAWSIKSHSTA